MNIKQKLLQEQDKKYKNFQTPLIPNIKNVLGVRIPVLRKFAKEIYKFEDWQNFLEQNDFEFMEEVMLQGFVIGEIKCEIEKHLEYIKSFIPKIDNWAVCDCFCSSLKFVKKNQDLVWKFIEPYFSSNNEYDIRFAYVMGLDYFVDDKYIDKLFEKAETFSDTRYYTKMAVAWMISVCFAKFPQKTFKYLQNSNLNKWTFNKSIQKICESYRVSKEEKIKVRGIKK